MLIDGATTLCRGGELNERDLRLSAGGISMHMQATAHRW